MNIHALNEATVIFLKYGDGDSSLCAEHDEIYIGVCTPDRMSEEDVKRLNELGFRYDRTYPCWRAFT